MNAPGVASRFGILPTLGIAQLFGWSSTYFLPAVLAPVIARDIGLSLEAIFLASTVFSVAMAAASPFLAGVLTRRGARPVLTAGSVVLAMALAAASLAGSPAPFFAAWALLGVGGAMALGAPAFTALAEAHGAGARRSIGLVMLMTGLSGSLAFPGLALLEATLGWRASLLLMAALHLIVFAPVHWLLIPEKRAPTPLPPPPPAETPAGPAPVAVVDPGGGRPEAAIDPLLFGLFALSVSCAIFVSVGFEITRIEIFRALGLEEALAIGAASAIGVAQVAARAADAAFGQRVEAVFLAIVAMIVAPASFLLLAFAPDALWSLALFVALYGAATGLLTVLRATLPLELFSPEVYGAAATRAALPTSLASAAAPPVFAISLQQGGGAAALALGGAGFVCALAAMIALHKVRRGHWRMRVGGL